MDRIAAIKKEIELHNKEIDQYEKLIDEKNVLIGELLEEKLSLEKEVGEQNEK